MAYQLPTEAQWEYACRAGTRSAYSFGDGSAELYRYSNYADRNTNFDWSDKAIDDGFETISPVGTYPINPWGFHDMHGNVWEWCADWYGDYPRGAVRDPVAPASSSNHIFRGGSWLTTAKHARCAYRGKSGPNYSDNALGFRLSLRSVSQ
jgi:formylglycine-generating enzyme required for sulfatase activity